MVVFAGDAAFSQLINDLESRGVIPKEIVRVVVDIQMGQPIKVYYESFADKGLLEALPRMIDAMGFENPKAKK